MHSNAQPPRLCTPRSAIRPTLDRLTRTQAADQMQCVGIALDQVASAVALDQVASAGPSTQDQSSLSWFVSLWLQHGAIHAELRALGAASREGGRGRASEVGSKLLLRVGRLGGRPPPEARALALGLTVANEGVIALPGRRRAVGPATTRSESLVGQAPAPFGGVRCRGREMPPSGERPCYIWRPASTHSESLVGQRLRRPAGPLYDRASTTR